MVSTVEARADGHAGAAGDRRQRRPDRKAAKAEAVATSLSLDASGAKSV